MAEREVRRGDIWWLDWDPPRGSEQSGRRPALIVQNDVGNRYSTNTIVVAITRTRRSNPVIVPIPASQSGLQHDSYIHAGQVLTVDKSRLLSRIGQASAGIMGEVNQAIRISLDV